jgi:ribokinase
VSSLRSSGVDTRYLLEVADYTGAAFIGVAEDGENSILVASGANLALHPQHLPNLSQISHLLLQLESPMVSVVSFAKRAHQAGIPVILNAAPARTLEPGLLGCVHTLIVNEGELEQLVPSNETQSSVLSKARALVKQGPSVVIVTMGSQGCIAYTAEGTTLAIPSLPVEVRDTTGAGDTFVGVLVAYLAKGLGLAAALHAANAGAALSCTRAGAQPSMPTLLEIETLVQSTRS